MPRGLTEARNGEITPRVRIKGYDAALLGTSTSVLGGVGEGCLAKRYSQTLLVAILPATATTPSADRPCTWPCPWPWPLP
jgi:hypothetical protein